MVYRAWKQDACRDTVMETSYDGIIISYVSELFTDVEDSDSITLVSTTCTLFPCFKLYTSKQHPYITVPLSLSLYCCPYITHCPCITVPVSLSLYRCPCVTVPISLIVPVSLSLYHCPCIAVPISLFLYHCSCITVLFCLVPFIHGLV